MTSKLIQNICQEISTYAVFVAWYILADRIQYFRTHTHERASAFLTAHVAARKYLVHVAVSTYPDFFFLYLGRC